MELGCSCQMPWGRMGGKRSLGKLLGGGEKGVSSQEVLSREPATHALGEGTG